jgi:hypothetical protein
VSDRNHEAIFVVGVPNSGTTLLAAMLCAHSRLSCGPETHFFTALQSADRTALCRRASWPGPALDFLFSIEQGDHPVPENHGFSREEIAAYLRGQRPSVPAILSSLTEQYMRRTGKQRWVEKTPNHLPWVRDIRSCFPRARFVRIVRDPRAVALSLQKVPWGPGTFVEGLLYWRDFDDASEPVLRSDPLCHTLRYEDLLDTPEETLRALCAFLGEDFEPGMLDTSESARHVNRINESWKGKVGSAIDPTRGSSWRGQISDAEARCAEALLGDRLRSYGYPREEGTGRRYLSAYPMKALARYPALLDALVGDGVRFWPAAEGEVPEAALYVGDFDRDNWVWGGSIKRLAGAAGIALGAWGARAGGRRVYCLCEPGPVRGYCARLLKWCFALGGVRRVPPEPGACLEQVGRGWVNPRAPEGQLNRA